MATSGRECLDGDSLGVNGLARPPTKRGSMDEFTGVSWLELRSYLVNTLLRDTDAMSMHHSLEVRVPFLDSSLVEYLLSLPESQKRNAAQPKALLIAALGELLPQELIAQPKRTFTFPWENWMRGALRETNRSGAGRLVAGSRAVAQRRKCAAGLGRFPGEPNDVVAAMEPLCA